MATSVRITSYPWQPDSTRTALRAIGDLGTGLMRDLKTQRGIHTETLFAAVGALAGFAAQNAALDRIASQDPAAPRLSIAILQTKSGEKFIAGDAVNVFLYPEPHSTLPLFAMIAGAATQAGVPETELPKYQDMAAHTASLVGSADFGKLRAPPEHRPHLQPVELLRQLWPMALNVLQRPPREKLFSRAEKPLQEAHWPLVISLVAGQFMRMTKGVLNPRISAALVMESAVITSKVDPESIDPGKWRIDPSDAAKPITRLRK
jgi:hypothetical protein